MYIFFLNKKKCEKSRRMVMPMDGQRCCSAIRHRWINERGRAIPRAHQQFDRRRRSTTEICGEEMIQNH